MQSSNSDRSCLGCGGKTKSVSAQTVTSLVALRKEQDNDGYRFCPTQSCNVVYSRRASDTLVYRHELDVEVFQKSTNPNRPVCYCFDYSVRDVEAGGPAIFNDIQTKCRAGLDRCAERNPQGSCCLGNVRKVAQRMMLETNGGEHEAAGNCCASADLSE